MSNAATNVCWRLRMPPTQKVVLMCLADFCHDDGKDWHSIAAMVEWTCLGKRTVIDALKALEDAGLIVIQRSLGNKNTTLLQLQRIADRPENQCTSRTGAGGAPVQEPHSTSAPAALPPVHVAHQPVQEAHPNHVEPSVNHQEPPKKRTRVRALPPAPDGVDQQVWSDWIEVRKGKKAGKVTPTALEGLRREAGKAGIDVEAAIRFCVEANWVGFNAGWYADRMAKSGAGGDVIDGRDILPGWRLAELEKHKAMNGPAFSLQSDELLRRHHAAVGKAQRVGQAEGRRGQRREQSLEELTAGVERRLGIASKHSGFDDIDYTEGLSDDGRIA